MFDDLQRFSLFAMYGAKWTTVCYDIKKKFGISYLTLCILFIYLEDTGPHTNSISHNILKVYISFHSVGKALVDRFCEGIKRGIYSKMGREVTWAIGQKTFP